MLFTAWGVAGIIGPYIGGQLFDKFKKKADSGGEKVERIEFAVGPNLREVDDRSIPANKSISGRISSSLSRGMRLTLWGQIHATSVALLS